MKKGILLFKNTIQILCIVVFAQIFISCNKDEDASPEVDFGRYVAVGNSLTAGISNNGLYNTSIKNSYPNLLAGQMQKVGGGAFEQAYFAAGQENGTSYLKLIGYNGLVPNIATVTNNIAYRSIEPFLLTKYSGDNQNLGMPFMKMSEVDTPDLKSNIFFERLQSESNSPGTYLQLIDKTKPTFFTCWLGNNDLLTYVNTGGTRPATAKDVFASNLKKLLDQLTKNGAKGLIANISDVTQAPTYRVIAGFRPLFTSTKFYVATKTGVREGTAQDLLLPPSNLTSLDLATLSAKGTTINSPWQDNEVLDPTEQAELMKITKEYNDIIAKEASARKLALMDSFAFMEKLKNGVNENGDEVNTAYLSGGFFSLDGAHLTPKGYAFTANEFAKAINAYYKTKIPLLDTKLYKGVVVEP